MLTSTDSHVTGFEGVKQLHNTVEGKNLLLGDEYRSPAYFCTSHYVR